MDCLIAKINLWHKYLSNDLISNFNWFCNLLKPMLPSKNLFFTLLSLNYVLYPVDTGRKLNVHKTFRRRPGRLWALCLCENMHVRYKLESFDPFRVFRNFVLNIFLHLQIHKVSSSCFTKTSVAEAYSEPCHLFKMEYFSKIGNWKPLTFSLKTPS